MKTGSMNKIYRLLKFHFLSPFSIQLFETLIESPSGWLELQFFRLKYLINKWWLVAWLPIDVDVPLLWGFHAQRLRLINYIQDWNKCPTIAILNLATDRGCYKPLIEDLHNFNAWFLFSCTIERDPPLVVRSLRCSSTIYSWLD